MHRKPILLHHDVATVAVVGFASVATVWTSPFQMNQVTSLANFMSQSCIRILDATAVAWADGGKGYPIGLRASHRS